MRWFTSDLHFGHHNIIQYSSRPFEDAAHMNDELVRRFNERVRDEDTVYLLGDICMGQLEETFRYVPQLKGHKILVPGNHDIVHPHHKRNKHEELVRRFIALFDYVHPFGEDVVLPGPRGERLHLSHYPTVFEEDWSIHGHVHDLWKVDGKKINVGVDVWNWYPVSEEDLHEVIRRS